VKRHFKSCFYLSGLFITLAFLFQNCTSPIHLHGVRGRLIVVDNSDNGTDQNQGSDTGGDDNSSGDDDNSSGGDDTAEPTPTPAPNDGVAKSLYACIIQETGKSWKVAYESEDKKTKYVCMSERACNNIIGRVAGAVEPEARSYCAEKNPNVISFSDTEIEELANQ
jgi:hypothetical protein